MARRDFNQETLKEFLDYNPDTGIFVWKKRPSPSAGRAVVGGRAGFLGLRYITICIFQEHYQAHILAWLYHYGEWPDKDIDHINGIGTDNSIKNLRLASDSQNLCNRSKTIKNKSGYKGVSYNKDGGVWVVHIRANGKNKNCGRFKSLIDAAKAYDKVAIKYHGEFAKLNFPEEYNLCG